MGFETLAEARATNLYFDRTFECDAAKVLPGEYFVTDAKMALVTTLGSCVAACIRDVRTGIGGMNHFMLPEGRGDPGNPIGASARYGTYAMELLINELIKLGARRPNLEAKVFGGGNVLSGLAKANVGKRNAVFALEFLATENIRVAAKDLLDEYPRKVYYFPRDGRVLVRKLRSMRNDTVRDRESAYLRRLDRESVSGEVELFS
jgi:chemotaxis protein CheD